MSYFIYALNIIALMLVLLIGQTKMGAQRWLSLGLINFQPSEMMKISLVLVLARYYEKMDITNPPHPLYHIAYFMPYYKLQHWNAGSWDNVYRDFHCFLTRIYSACSRFFSI